MDAPPPLSGGGGGANGSSGRGRGSRMQTHQQQQQQYGNRRPQYDFSEKDTIAEESFSSSSSPLSRRSPKKPEQQFYIPKQQQGQRPQLRNKYHHNGGGDNYNNFRGNSEPRSATETPNYISTLESRLDPSRPRDSRSVDPNYMIRDKKPPMGGHNNSGSGHGGGGRRNSANIDGNGGGGGGNERIPRLPLNINSLAPRLKKHFLQKSGLPLTYLEEKSNMDEVKEARNRNFNYPPPMQQQQHPPPSNWTQTLPNMPRGRGRGRGRIAGDSRPETPVEHSRPRSRSSDITYDNYELYPERPSSRNNYQYESRNKNRGGGKNDFRSSNRSINNFNPQDNYQQQQEHYNRNNDGYNRGGHHNEFRRDGNKDGHYRGGNKKRNDFDNRRKSDNCSASSGGGAGYNNNANSGDLGRHDNNGGYVKMSSPSVQDRIQNKNIGNLRIEENLADKIANVKLGSPSPQITDSLMFDWSEEVERANSKKEEFQNSIDDEGHKQQQRTGDSAHDNERKSDRNQNHRNDHPRHRSNSNSKRRAAEMKNNKADNFYKNEHNPSNYVINDVKDEFDHFKAPQNHTSKNYRNRSRRNSQVSIGLSRESSEDRTYPGASGRHSANRNRKNSYNSGYVGSRDNSMDRRENFPQRTNRSRQNSGRYSASRENSSDRTFWSNQRKESTNWRSEMVDRSEIDPKSQQQQQPGIIKLPSPPQQQQQQHQHAQNLSNEHIVYEPLPSLPPPFTTNAADNNAVKTLFDPKNPNKPIVVNNATQRRTYKQQDLESSSTSMDVVMGVHPQHQQTRAVISEQYFHAVPHWYDKKSQVFQMLHKPDLVDNLQNADWQIQLLIKSGVLFNEWETYISIRLHIQHLMEQILINDMKFCQQENVETHFWKILYHSIIDLLRKYLNDDSNPGNKEFFKEKLLEIIDSGSKFLQELLTSLESAFTFSVDDFVGENASATVNPSKGSKYTRLALVSAQKILIFLGDLARYREQINETNNYGKVKQWYMKAQQIFPNNGRPYNSLAVLSVISKRKIDAVYFFMRSIMSSNPFQSAKESLVGLFDENRKKYESTQRKREEKNRARLKEKEHRFGGPLRRETWIHPKSGHRIHRTSPLDPEAGRNGDTSEEEELKQLDTIELNKRFILSYLHVLGKLYTNVGMESFSQCAIQMLREFRALLRHSPIAITSHRLLQLMALNMFAIDTTELKIPDITPGARSQVQEQAISISLLMFGIILERFYTVLKESVCGSSKSMTPNAPVITLGGEIVTNNMDPHHSKHRKSKSSISEDTNRNERLSESSSSAIGNALIDSGSSESKKQLVLPEDAKVMLPAIKVWCDWLFHHNKVWNPPPSCSDYKLGSNSTHDPWNGLASIASILETVDTNKTMLTVEQKEFYDLVRLQEDITLAGFTPLMSTIDPIYYQHDEDLELAQNSLRILKLVFFCSNYLCTCDPPVLKIIENNNNNDDDNNKTPSQYISVVHNRTDESSDSELLVESFSDDEDDEDVDEGIDVQRESDDTFVNSKRLSVGMMSVSNSDSNSVNKRQSSSEFVSGASEMSYESAAEIRKLLQRKDELEQRNRIDERNTQRRQDILRQSTVSLHIEVRPKYLVPDTNCFVDFLQPIVAIARAHPTYQLMVPVVVINELEGLSRGGKINSAILSANTPLTPKLDIFTSPNAVRSGTSGTTYTNRLNDAEHALKVADASKKALDFLRSKQSSVKCVTTKGSVLKSSKFTDENDNSEMMSNDDKILTTALNLCELNSDKKMADVGETRSILRDVVLLTTDRNLRVKALTRDLPVRELPDFIKWAELGGSGGSSSSYSSSTSMKTATPKYSASTANTTTTVAPRK